MNDTVGERQLIERLLHRETLVLTDVKEVERYLDKMIVLHHEVVEALRTARAPDFDRRVFVENRLLNAATGKEPPPTPEECRTLAMKLGVPDDFPRSREAKDE